MKVVNTGSLHLSCSATGIKEPTYRHVLSQHCSEQSLTPLYTHRWLFGGEEEEVVGGGGRVDLSENGDLWIRDLTYNDTGEYMCVAETGAGSDSITHSVTVEGEGPTAVCLGLINY